MNKVMKGEIEFFPSPQPKYQESGSIPNELKETIWDENSKNFRNLATHNFG
jgi:hypothetical protein